MASATSEFLNPLKWRRGMNRLKAFNDLRRGIFTEEGTSKDLLSGGIRILTGRSKVSSLRQNQALGGLASNVRKTLKYEEDPTTHVSTPAIPIDPAEDLMW